MGRNFLRPVELFHAFTALRLSPPAALLYPFHCQYLDASTSFSPQHFLEYGSFDTQLLQDVNLDREGPDVNGTAENNMFFSGAK